MILHFREGFKSLMFNKKYCGKLPNKALMEYRLMSPEIGSVEEASNLFLNARVQMDKKYDRKIDCRIRLGTYYEGKPAILVEMREREEGSLKPALKEFFSNVGVPSFVISGSNYDLISSILKERNKKLQRKLKGALRGKYVVNSTFKSRCNTLADV